MQPSIDQTACLCVYLSICLSIVLSIFLFRDLSISLSIRISFHLSFGLSICLVVYLPIQLSIQSISVPKHFTHPSIWFLIFPSSRYFDSCTETKQCEQNRVLVAVQLLKLKNVRNHSTTIPMVHNIKNKAILRDFLNFQVDSIKNEAILRDFYQK